MMKRVFVHDSMQKFIDAVRNDGSIEVLEGGPVGVGVQGRAGRRQTARGREAGGEAGKGHTLAAVLALSSESGINL